MKPLPVTWMADLVWRKPGCAVTMLAGSGSSVAPGSESRNENQTPPGTMPVTTGPDSRSLIMGETIFPGFEGGAFGRSRHWATLPPR